MPNEQKNMMTTAPRRKTSVSDGGFTITIWTISGMVLAACGGGGGGGGSASVISPPASGDGRTASARKGLLVNAEIWVDTDGDGEFDASKDTRVGVTNELGEADIERQYDGMRVFVRVTSDTRDSAYENQTLSPQVWKSFTVSSESGVVISPLTDILTTRIVKPTGRSAEIETALTNAFTAGSGLDLGSDFTETTRGRQTLIELNGTGRQKVLDAIFGKYADGRSVVTISDILDPDNYQLNRAGTDADRMLDDLIEYASLALTVARQNPVTASTGDSVAVNTEALARVVELFGDWRDAAGDAASGVEFDPATSLTAGAFRDSLLAFNPVARPVIVDPNSGNTISGREDTPVDLASVFTGLASSDVARIQSTAQQIFGFRDPLGNSDSVSGLHGVYINPVAVNNRQETLATVMVAGDNGTYSVLDRHLDGGTHAGAPDGYFFVGLADLKNIRIMPAENYNDTVAPQNRPVEIRFHIHDGEEWSQNLGTLKFSFASVDDASVVTLMRADGTAAVGRIIIDGNGNLLDGEGREVTLLNATDIDAPSGFNPSFSVGGADGGLFRIVGNRISFRDTDNIKPLSDSYNITITARDGAHSGSLDLQMVQAGIFVDGNNVVAITEEMDAVDSGTQIFATVGGLRVSLTVTGVDFADTADLALIGVSDASVTFTEDAAAAQAVVISDALGTLDVRFRPGATNSDIIDAINRMPIGERNFEVALAAGAGGGDTVSSTASAVPLVGAASSGSGARLISNAPGYQRGFDLGPITVDATVLAGAVEGYFLTGAAHNDDFRIIKRGGAHHLYYIGTDSGDADSGASNLAVTIGVTLASPPAGAYDASGNSGDNDYCWFTFTGGSSSHGRPTITVNDDGTISIGRAVFRSHLGDLIEDTTTTIQGSGAGHIVVENQRFRFVTEDQRDIPNQYLVATIDGSTGALGFRDYNNVSALTDSVVRTRTPTQTLTFNLVDIDDNAPDDAPGNAGFMAASGIEHVGASNPGRVADVAAVDAIYLDAAGGGAVPRDFRIEGGFFSVVIDTSGGALSNTVSVAAGTVFSDENGDSVIEGRNFQAASFENALGKDFIVRLGTTIATVEMVDDLSSVSGDYYVLGHAKGSVVAQQPAPYTGALDASGSYADNASGDARIFTISGLWSGVSVDSNGIVTVGALTIVRDNGESVTIAEWSDYLPGGAQNFAGADIGRIVAARQDSGDFVIMGVSSGGNPVGSAEFYHLADIRPASGGGYTISQNTAYVPFTDATMNTDDGDDRGFFFILPEERYTATVTSTGFTIPTGQIRLADGTVLTINAGSGDFDFTANSVGFVTLDSLTGDVRVVTDRAELGAYDYVLGRLFTDASTGQSFQRNAVSQPDPKIQPHFTAFAERPGEVFVFTLTGGGGSFATDGSLTITGGRVNLPNGTGFNFEGMVFRSADATDKLIVVTPDGTVQAVDSAGDIDGAYYLLGHTRGSTPNTFTPNVPVQWTDASGRISDGDTRGFVLADATNYDPTATASTTTIHAGSLTVADGRIIRFSGGEHDTSDLAGTHLVVQSSRNEWQATPVSAEELATLRAATGSEAEYYYLGRFTGSGVNLQLDPNVTQITTRSDLESAWDTTVVADFINTGNPGEYRIEKSDEGADATFRLFDGNDRPFVADSETRTFMGAYGNITVDTAGIVRYTLNPASTVTLNGAAVSDDVIIYVTDARGGSHVIGLRVPVNEPNGTIRDIETFDLNTGDYRIIAIDEMTTAPRGEGLALFTRTLTDADTGDTVEHTLRVVDYAGMDVSSRFRINRETGAVSVRDNIQLSHEVSPYYVFSIIGTSGSSLPADVEDANRPAASQHGAETKTETRTVIMRVDDVREAPTGVTISRSVLIAPDGTDINSLPVGILGAIDEDAGETYTFTIGGGRHASLFEVNGNTLIYIGNNGQANNLLEVGESYELIINVSDGRGPAVGHELTIFRGGLYIEDENGDPAYYTGAERALLPESTQGDVTRFEIGTIDSAVIPDNAQNVILTLADAQQVRRFRDSESFTKQSDFRIEAGPDGFTLYYVGARSSGDYESGDRIVPILVHVTYDDVNGVSVAYNERYEIRLSEVKELGPQGNTILGSFADTRDDDGGFSAGGRFVAENTGAGTPVFSIVDADTPGTNLGNDGALSKQVRIRNADGTENLRFVEFGTITLDADGNWQFTGNADGIDFIPDGTQVTLNFAVRSTTTLVNPLTGASHDHLSDTDFAITITGANEVPTGAEFAAGTGAFLPVNQVGTPSSPFVVATLEAIDPDNTGDYVFRDLRATRTTPEGTVVEVPDGIFRLTANGVLELIGDPGSNIVDNTFTVTFRVADNGGRAGSETSDDITISFVVGGIYTLAAGAEDISANRRFSDHVNDDGSGLVDEDADGLLFVNRVPVALRAGTRTDAADETSFAFQFTGFDASDVSAANPVGSTVTDTITLSSASGRIYLPTGTDFAFAAASATVTLAGTYYLYVHQATAGSWTAAFAHESDLGTIAQQGVAGSTFYILGSVDGRGQGAFDRNLEVSDAESAQLVGRLGFSGATGETIFTLDDSAATGTYANDQFTIDRNGDLRYIGGDRDGDGMPDASDVDARAQSLTVRIRVDEYAEAADRPLDANGNPKGAAYYLLDGGISIERGFVTISRGVIVDAETGRRIEFDGRGVSHGNGEFNIVLFKSTVGRDSNEDKWDLRLLTDAQFATADTARESKGIYVLGTFTGDITDDAVAENSLEQAEETTVRSDFVDYVVNLSAVNDEPPAFNAPISAGNALVSVNIPDTVTPLGDDEAGNPVYFVTRHQEGITTTVFTADAEDQDTTSFSYHEPAETVVYSLTGRDAEHFTIEQTGAVRFVSGSDADLEDTDYIDAYAGIVGSEPSFGFEFRYTGGHVGYSRTDAGVYSVSDVRLFVREKATNEITAYTVSGADNLTFSQANGGLHVVRQGSAGSYTWQMTNIRPLDPAAVFFTIRDSENGDISTFDARGQMGVYEVDVVATTGSDSAFQRVVVVLENANDAPEPIMLNTVLTRGQGTPPTSNVEVGTVLPNDPDDRGGADGSYTFELTDNAATDNALFTINQSTGVVAYNSSTPRKATGNTYTIEVTVTDRTDSDSLLMVTEQFTIIEAGLSVIDAASYALYVNSATLPATRFELERFTGHRDRDGDGILTENVHYREAGGVPSLTTNEVGTGQVETLGILRYPLPETGVTDVEYAIASGNNFITNQIEGVEYSQDLFRVETASINLDPGSVTPRIEDFDSLVFRGFAGDFEARDSYTVMVEVSYSLGGVAQTPIYQTYIVNLADANDRPEFSPAYAPAGIETYDDAPARDPSDAAMLDVTAVAARRTMVINGIEITLRDPADTEIHEVMVVVDSEGGDTGITVDNQNNRVIIRVQAAPNDAVALSDFSAGIATLNSNPTLSPYSFRLIGDGTDRYAAKTFLDFVGSNGRTILASADTNANSGNLDEGQGTGNSGIYQELFIEGEAGNILSGHLVASGSLAAQAVYGGAADSAFNGGAVTVSSVGGRVVTYQGIYGALELSANGGWVYNLDHDLPAFHSLNYGALRTELFTITVSAGNQTAQQQIRISITGEVTGEPVIEVSDRNLSAVNTATATEAGLSVTLGATRLADATGSPFDGDSRKFASIEFSEFYTTLADGVETTATDPVVYGQSRFNVSGGTLTLDDGTEITFDRIRLSEIDAFTGGSHNGVGYIYIAPTTTPGANWRPGVTTEYERISVFGGYMIGMLVPDPDEAAPNRNPNAVFLPIMDSDGNVDNSVQPRGNFGDFGVTIGKDTYSGGSIIATSTETSPTFTYGAGDDTGASAEGTGTDRIVTYTGTYGSLIVRANGEWHYELNDDATFAETSATDTFMVTVSDGTNSVARAIEIKVSKPHEVTESGATGITFDMLGINDPDGDEEDFVFTVISTEFGSVQRLESGVWTTIDDDETFTYDEVTSNQIRFNHDGTEYYGDADASDGAFDRYLNTGVVNTPNFVFTVLDDPDDKGAAIPYDQSSASGGFNPRGKVSFVVTPVASNPVEDTTADFAASVIERTTYAFTRQDISFADPDSTADEIVYTIIGGPMDTTGANGALMLWDGTGDAAVAFGADNLKGGSAERTFTQEDINAGRLIYVHSDTDRTDTTVTFMVSVEGITDDGDQTETVTLTIVDINDAPEPMIMSSDRQASEGNPADTATGSIEHMDPDTRDSFRAIVYTITGNDEMGMARDEVTINSVTATTGTVNGQYGVLTWTLDSDRNLDWTYAADRTREFFRNYGSTTTPLVMDTFTVALSDGDNDVAAGAATNIVITVTGSDDAMIALPTGNDATATAGAGGYAALTGTSLAATDINGNTLTGTYTVETQGTLGTFTITNPANGAWSYLAAPPTQIVGDASTDRMDTVVVLFTPTNLGTVAATEVTIELTVESFRPGSVATEIRNGDTVPAIVDTVLTLDITLTAGNNGIGDYAPASPINLDLWQSAVTGVAAVNLNDDDDQVQGGTFTALGAYSFTALAGLAFDANDANAAAKGRLIYTPDTTGDDSIRPVAGMTTERATTVTFTPNSALPVNMFGQYDGAEVRVRFILQGPATGSQDVTILEANNTNDNDGDGDTSTFNTRSGSSGNLDVHFLDASDNILEVVEKDAGSQSTETQFVAEPGRMTGGTYTFTNSDTDIGTFAINATTGSWQYASVIDFRFIRENVPHNIAVTFDPADPLYRNASYTLAITITPPENLSTIEESLNDDRNTMNGDIAEITVTVPARATGLGDFSLVASVLEVLDSAGMARDIATTGSLAFENNNNEEGTAVWLNADNTEAASQTSSTTGRWGFKFASFPTAVSGRYDADALAMFPTAGGEDVTVDFNVVFTPTQANINTIGAVRIPVNVIFEATAENAVTPVIGNTDSTTVVHKDSGNYDNLMGNLAATANSNNIEGMTGITNAEFLAGGTWSFANKVAGSTADLDTSTADHDYAGEFRFTNTTTGEWSYNADETHRAANTASTTDADFTHVVSVTFTPTNPLYDDITEDITFTIADM